MKMSKLSPLVCLLLAFVYSMAAVASERYPLQTEQQRQWFAELTADLRCPKCQNQNIADSNATVSVDMKRKVHQLLLDGHSKQQIIDYMKQRYGDFVYYQPPVNTVTSVLWWGPGVILLIALWLFFARRFSKDGTRGHNSERSAELIKIDDLLKDDIEAGPKEPK